MDGKTPPTTSVVIDLEKPLTYELTPGPAGKVILTLHSEGGATSVAKNSPAPAAKVSNAVPAVKAAVPAAQPQAVAKPAVVAKAGNAKPVTAKPVTAKPVDAKTVAVVASPFTKPLVSPSKPDPKQQGKAAPVAKIAAPAVKAPAGTPATSANTAKSKEEKLKEEKKWAMSGKRDPFFSPVVSQTGGSGCSTGKKCLEIGQINLRGVVKSENGFIAVVTNTLNKAYFLREKDPVFNGYVVRITGDSVVFQETVQDKLGKAFTREVVKRIFTPAV